MRHAALLALVMGTLGGCATSCGASADEPPPPADTGSGGLYTPTIMDWLPNTRWDCEWHDWEVVNGVETRARVSHHWHFKSDTYHTDLAERLVEEFDAGRVTQSMIFGSIWATQDAHGGVKVIVIDDQPWEPLGANSILGLWKNDTLTSVYQDSRFVFTRDGPDRMTIDASATNASEPITCTRTLF